MRKTFPRAPARRNLKNAVDRRAAFQWFEMGTRIKKLVEFRAISCLLAQILYFDAILRADFQLNTIGGSCPAVPETARSQH